MGTMAECESHTFLNTMLQYLIKFKIDSKQAKSEHTYEVYISCYEVTSDENEEVTDLIKASMSSNSGSSHDQTDGEVSEGDMQEICLDSDEFEELTMVVEDIISKRQFADIAGQIFTVSNLGKPLYDLFRSDLPFSPQSSDCQARF
jgi:hypothetical protein